MVKIIENIPVLFFHQHHSSSVIYNSYNIREYLYMYEEQQKLSFKSQLFCNTFRTNISELLHDKTNDLNFESSEDFHQPARASVQSDQSLL